MTDDMREAHPASWYIAQGIKDIESVPKTYRDSVDDGFADTEDRLNDLDTRLRKMDTKYNEVLGIMHELGERIAKATEALVAYSKAQNKTPQD